jgi:hypothetical protein
MEGFARVFEEKAVFDAHAGADGAGDVDPAALVGGGDDVEAGESEAEEEADGGPEQCLPSVFAVMAIQMRNGCEHVSRP